LKLVGGCRLTQDAPDTAQRALEFARAFAAAAQLTIVAEDIGGVLGREVVYWPGTGQLRIRKLRGLQALVAGRERDYGESLRALRAGADTEGGRVG
jgi:chemotaxis protein CheD